MTWPEVPIGQLCELVNGRAFKPSDWTEDGLPIVRIQNLNDPDAPFNRFNGEVRDRFLISSGALLFSWSGTPGTSFGAFFWHRGRAVLNQHIFHVLVRKGVDANYFRYAINARIDSIIAQAHGGVGLQHITKDKLEATPLPLPPLPEQRRIADILDKADAVRRKRKETIALTEELLRSAFLEMFGDPVTNPKGWPVEPMGQAIDRFEAGWSANGDARERAGDEYGVLKVSAVTSGYFRPEEHKAVAAAEVDRELVTPRQGDLLFSRANTRELVAACCLIERDEPKLFLPDKLWRIVAAGRVATPEYLKFLLGHGRFRSELTKRATGTSGSMLNISMEKVRTMEMPVPPIVLQKRFSSFVWQAYRLRGRLAHAGGASDDLFGALAQRAFRGELGAAA